MKISGQHRTALWEHSDGDSVVVIDQKVLPHRYETLRLRTRDDARLAISDMTVRGAPLIGVTAAYGLWLASLEWSPGSYRQQAQRDIELLASARPTAVNLAWALETLASRLVAQGSKDTFTEVLLAGAREVFQRELKHCRAIGDHGVALIEAAHQKNPERPVRILTHCNAGWLACLDWGTATSPVYVAQERGIPVEVWVDETRPRNQGAHLTAFELLHQGVPHHVIVDNAGGHLMQHGQVDLCIVGADRVTRRGDAANKIGTYLKALAAKDNDVPFYVALPTSTLDLRLADGVAEIPIEERSPEEVTHVAGWDGEEIRRVRITPEASPARNFGFDVTPARLITRLITERGICEPTESAISELMQRSQAAE